ncbi:MAG: cyclic pyranopterin monophosphate synthase MoaC [Magnetococcus sp. MYC-9]
MSEQKTLSHFDAQGATRMVDVTDKASTARMAVATGEVHLRAETLELILNRQLSKGDVLEVARLAGIMAAKRVDMLIPLCHQINLTSVRIEFAPEPAQQRIGIIARVRTQGQTGVEMEAMTAVAVAGLTIYDMCKAVDRGMAIGPIRLLEKEGGKSGHFVAEGYTPC